MLKKHLVIIGGGWAGISLARDLKHLSSHKLRITLVSNEPNFRYSAALYRVATGHKEREAIIPIHKLVGDISSLKFIRSTATNIEPATKTINLANGDLLHYDYAVLALGSVTSYYDIPGLKELSYSIKSQKELNKLRSHIHQDLLKDNQLDKNYVVVGGGPTGVELAAALASYLKAIARRHGIKRGRINIELIEAAPRLLPNSNLKASVFAAKRLKKLGVKILLGKKVEYETTQTLRVNGRSIPSHTVIWTAGVVNNPFFAHHKDIFKLNQNNQVIVDDHLRTHSLIYVIGDNAVTPFTGLGLTAVHNAKYVAKDITKRLAGQRKTPIYKPLKPATVVPVGKNWAIFEYGKLVISGRIGGLIRSVADLIAYADIAGFKKGYNFWRQTEDLEETCSLCKSRLIHISSEQVDY